MSILQLHNIRHLLPSQGVDSTGNLRLQDGQLTPCEALDPDLPCIDGSGLWLMPGPIDLGHHLLPGRHIAGADARSELLAAKRCGIAAAAITPDNFLNMDSAGDIAAVRALGKAPDACSTLPVGNLTPGGLNEQLSNMAALQQAGCRGLSQGDAPLPPLDLLRQAMRYAADLDITLFLSPRMPGLNQGCAHDGAMASTLGLPGIPAASESVAVACIAALVEDTGCRVHFSQLSSRVGAQAFARAKDRGLPVTADVAIWNLIFDEQALSAYDSLFHLQPPLREPQDRESLLSLLKSGSIDAVCSQHRPLNSDAKFAPFAETLPGACSIDTYLPLLLGLLASDALTPLELAACCSANPARILEMSVGEARNSWLLVDPRHSWELHAETLHSASRNTPLLGQTMNGAAAGWLEAGELNLFQNWQDRLRV